VEQAPLKHPLATSDNVSYVRLGVDFRLGFRGFLFFVVPLRVPACRCPAAGPWMVGPVVVLWVSSFGFAFPRAEVFRVFPIVRF
jgi:hypothetical protein